MSQFDLVNAIPLAALFVARDGRIEMANAGARALLGAAIVGRNYVTVLRQPALLAAVETALTGRAQKATYLTTTERRDTRFQVTCAPLGDKSGVLVCFEDRTDLEDAGQMRRDFVANVSHELKTPLTALLGFIETLRGAARDDPEARERFLSIMDREAHRMNRLVGDLLSLSRVEASARKRPEGRVNLKIMIGDVIASLRPMLETHGAEVAFSSDFEGVITGDSDQLSQVFTNLIENAVKYGGASPLVRVSLDVSDEHRNVGPQAVVISVSDTGRGIDPIHVPRLTERFYRIDDHRSREIGGTGLGLAIVKHVVQRHRGRLKIDSKVEQGSTFSVILPYKADA